MTDGKNSNQDRTMTIDEAVTKLEEHLGDCPEVFIVRHDGKVITVDVNFVYRIKDN